ncbi:MAG: esterase/lipase family protein [Candidatus Thermochlorobacter sp.]
MAQRTAILLHGIFDTGKVFSDLSAQLRKHGFRTLAPDLVPNDGSVSIATLAAQVKEIIEHEVEASAWLALIGFSMGGIVARYYLQELGGYQRVQRLITISSPHHGSWLAYAAEGEGIRDLRPDSHLLQRLNTHADRLLPLKPLSLWTPLDLMIVPAHSAVWQLATNLAFNVIAHPLMLRSEAVHRTVVEALLESKPEKPSYEEISTQN